VLRVAWVGIAGADLDVALLLHLPGAQASGLHIGQPPAHPTTTRLAACAPVGPLPARPCGHGLAVLEIPPPLGHGTGGPVLRRPLQRGIGPVRI